MYGYYSPLQTPILQQPLLPQQQTIQYVNDKSSAETYQMAPNSSVILMDANLPRFYTKITDASGQATIKSYDFKETEVEKPTEYVTKAEFESFKADLKGVNNESNNESVGK